MKNKLAKTMKQIVLLLVLGSLFLCPKSASAGNEADEETLEFDLRDGYLRLVALDSNLGSILDSFRYGGEDSEFFDLDGDGTADIKISTCYTVYYSYRGVLTPVFGGSIHGDFELKPTEEHPFRYTEWDYDAQKEVMHNVSSVVFHFPAEPVKEEYSLSGTGVKFSRYVFENGEYVKKEITKAAPGEEIELLEDKKTGQYLKAWKTDGLPKDDLTEVFPYETDAGESVKSIVAVRRFIMPAHDVTLEPVYENQRPYTIQVNGPNDYMVGNTEAPTNAVDCIIESLYNSEFCEDWEIGYCDLDGDGTDDIYIGPYKSDNSLNVCLFSNLTSYTEMAPNDGPYWPVTLSWKEEPTFTVDPAAMYYATVSAKNGRLLYRSLKAYEVEGKEGFFDLDQDGTEDLQFNGYNIRTLSTGSVEETITIPAVEDGVNHPITFDLRDKSIQYEFHKCTIICENEGKFSINSDEFDYIGEWFEKGEYIRLIPGEGYEFAAILIDGDPLAQDYYESPDIYVYDHDIEIRILFRTADGKIPGYHKVEVQGDYDILVQQEYDSVGPAQYSPYVKEGDWVIVHRNERKGDSYVASWEVTGVKDYTIGSNVSLKFQMQDEDVYVKPVFGKVEPLTIDLTNGPCSITDEILEDITLALGTDSQITVQSFRCDLNGDKKNDIIVTRVDKSTIQIKPLDDYSCGDTYELPEMNQFGHYHPITFVFKAEAEEPEPTGEPADASEKKEDGDSFHPLYFIIPACVLLCGGVTTVLLVRRKKHAAKGEAVEEKQEDKQE